MRPRCGSNLQPVPKFSPDWPDGDPHYTPAPWIADPHVRFPNQTSKGHLAVPGVGGLAGGRVCGGVCGG